MTTKKQTKSGKVVDWGLLAFKNLKQALASPDFTGKTELNKCKEIKALPHENIYRYIKICYGKLNLIFPLTKEEYDRFKELEFNEWTKENKTK